MWLKVVVLALLSTNSFAGVKVYFQDNNPPYSTKNGSKVQGIAPERVGKILKNLGVDSIAAVASQEEALAKAIAGEALFVGPAQPKEIEDQLQKTRSIVQMTLALLVRQDSTISYHGISSLKNLYIGVTKGESYDKAWQQAIEQRVFIPVEKTEQQNLALLGEGRLHGVLLDHLKARHIIKGDASGQFKVLEDFANPNEGLFVFGQKQAFGELLSSLDQQLLLQVPAREEGSKQIGKKLPSSPEQPKLESL